MPFNGSGIFSRLYSWANDAAASIKIRADRMDNEMNGFATGLTNCVTRDGQSPATANLPMGGYKHTNVADATANNEYATLSQVISKGVIYCPTVGGTANAITLSSGLSIASYYAGLTLEFIVGTSNTGATTIALDGMAAKSVKRRASTDLGSNDLIIGTIAQVVYDGTNFQLISMRGIRTTDINDNQVTTAKILDANVTLAKIEDIAAGKMLVRLPGSGTGVPVAADMTAAGYALMDDVNADAQLTTLGGSTVGKNLFTAASQSAAQSIIGMIFTKSFEKTGITISSSTTLGPYSHGLGAKPKMITYELVCTSADLSYSPGDSVYRYPGSESGGAQGLECYADATNIRVRVNANITPVDLLNGSYTSAGIDLAKWTLTLRAYA